MQDIQISIGQQFYSKDYDETLQVHSIREQPDPKIYLSGTTSDREVTLYKSDIVRLLNEERLKEVNTPKKSLNTDVLNSFMGDLAWGKDTEMDRLKQVYLSFSPQEKEFVDKNAVREGTNSIEEVFEKVLSKDEKEKLENKINGHSKRLFYRNWCRNPLVSVKIRGNYREWTVQNCLCKFHN